MNRLKKFSLAQWLKQLALSCRRFPVAVAFLLFLCCFIIFLNHGGKVGWEFFGIFYPASAALLGVSIQLLTEDFKSRVAGVITQCVAHAAWLGVSIYLSQFDKFSLPQFIAVAATIVTVALSVFLASFYRKNDDVPFWNFSGQTLVAMISSTVVGGALTLGLILFAQSLEWLFGLQVEDCVFADIPTVCMVLLAPLLFMNLIPAGEPKHSHRILPYSGFFKGVLQYLFIPLLLLYVVTLYVYAAKILFSWQLPVGWVSHLVTACMLGMVVLLYLTYPLQHDQGSSIFKRLTRWLPLVIMPLLALMTVAIARRLGDYGITVSRLYLLVFNIWCYVVCIGLLVTRNKRIWWIPASFAIVLFLISVGPQSIPNITQRQLLDEARKAFAASGIKELPLTGDQYGKWLGSADAKVAASIDAKLAYLQRDFGYGSTSSVLAKDAITGNHTTLPGVEGGVETSNGFYNDDLIDNVALPQGYSRMSVVDFHSDRSLLDDDKVVISLKAPSAATGDSKLNPDDEEYRFEFSASQLIQRDQERNPDGGVDPLVVDNGKALLMVNQFTFTLKGDKSYYLGGEGVLLVK